MPYAQWIAPAYYIIACAEAGANLGRYDGIRYGSRVGSPSTVQDMYTKNRSLLGAEVKKRIRMGLMYSVRNIMRIIICGRSDSEKG